MANNILKEAIADAKAVREVALANAKAALEEAFTPKLQSMLSAKLSETLNEEEDELEENFMDETMDETFVEEEVMEISGMDEEEEGADLDEEIDLEEILNELELEEGEEAKEEVKDMEEDMYEAKEEEKEEKLDEMGRPIYKAEDANYTGYTADRVHEGEEFNLDALLEEINNLDENEDEVNEGDFGEAFTGAGETPGARGGLGSSPFHPQKGETMDDYEARVGGSVQAKNILPYYQENPEAFARKTGVSEIAEEGMYEALETELDEVKAALKVKTTELNEVNLLNSKLLYVNRIFKANNLNEGQKLRVVETLDNASNVKEAKLIYETIKDTFNVAKSTKTTPKKSIREGLGMASKAAGTSTAPKKPVLNESNDMVSRMQKLANIKINQ